MTVNKLNLSEMPDLSLTGSIGAHTVAYSCSVNVTSVVSGSPAAVVQLFGFNIRMAIGTVVINSPPNRFGIKRTNARSL